ncbi:hypothetical protein MSG28_005044 [Choristoneura fumiferana]|uniref:Uncharacterized protein n=1 Tax=Choristoneura fumiferana TaxID=7141 RepID=A0ACC0JQB2_CHOFU|nr:hypothetical protein MSG28_005044 [Choristoneura fumiferana]
MIPLRQIARHAGRALPACRPMSSAPLVDVADSDGIAIMTLQRPPVNSLNLELLQVMNKSLDEIANNKPKGMILTSASKSVFTGGIDITELYQPDKKKFEVFWNEIHETWMKLFGFKFATAAAINGHAPGGGCLLAMSCEWRAMVGGKPTIGLNETVLGIVATPWTMDTMCHTLGPREAELALTSAKIFNADEALKVGLIDEIATDKEDAVEKCKKFIYMFDRIPPVARTLSKLRMRQQILAQAQKNRQQDMKDFYQSLNDPEVQRKLEKYVQSLKK